MFIAIPPAGSLYRADRLSPAVVPLTSGSSNSSSSSYVTSSISPSANKPVYVFFMARTGSVATTVTLSGCGLTWEAVGTPVATATLARRIYTFRSLGESPTPGALTFTCSVSQLGAIWYVFELNNSNTSGTNGSGSFIQYNSKSILSSLAGDLETKLEHRRNLNITAVGTEEEVSTVTEADNFEELFSAGIGNNITLSVQAGVGESMWAGSWDSSPNAAICAVEIKGAHIELLNPEIISSFSFDVDNLDVDFTDLSTSNGGIIVSWDWDFGDDTTSTSQNPSHTYEDGGEYTVSLTVTDDHGNTDNFSTEVTAENRLLPTPTVKLSGKTSTDGLTFTTASWTPEANKPVYAFFTCRHSASQPTIAVAGNGLTWVQVGSNALTGNGRYLALFRALGAAPTTGTTVFTCSTTQIAGLWEIIQVSDANTSGTHGSGATVQSKEATITTNTTGTITLNNPLEHPNNINITAVANNLNSETVTADSDFLELHGDAVTESLSISVQWGRNQTSCTSTYNSATAAMISVEVKAA